MRDKILTAARSLFIEHGYVGLSMREIAAAVGVSKPALYYHFRDKEDLFLAVVLEFLDEMGARLEHLTGISARERLTAFAHLVMTLPLEQRALIRLLTQESSQLPDESRRRILDKYQESFLGKVEAIIEFGMRSGELRSLSAHVVLWSLLGLLYPYTFLVSSGVHPAEDGADKAADQVLKIFFEGVQA